MTPLDQSPWLALADRFGEMSKPCPLVALAVQKGGMEPREIAELLGIDVSRVYQLERAALKKVRARLEIDVAQKIPGRIGSQRAQGCFGGST